MLSRSPCSLSSQPPRSLWRGLSQQPCDRKIILTQKWTCAAQIIYLVQTSQLLIKMKRTELRVKARRRAQAAANGEQQQEQQSVAGGTDEGKKAR